MHKLLLLFFIPLIAGCGVKDPSFYDLKSPCVSLGSPEDPCHRVSPELNQIYNNITS